MTKYELRITGECKQNETELILLLVNTGTHSDLFGKNFFALAAIFLGRMCKCYGKMMYLCPRKRQNYSENGNRQNRLLA